MLTVKVVYWDDSESVMQTRSVSTRAVERESSDAPLVMQAIYFQADNGANIEIRGSGTKVYVMNDIGKTVSVYELGDNNSEPVESGESK